MVVSRIVVTGVVMVCLIGGCSTYSSTGGSPATVPFAVDPDNEVAPTVPATLITDPQSDLDPPTVELVTVHAAWLCELQRRTFVEPGDIDSALQDHLERSGISVLDYEIFVADLASRQDLRNAVLFDYQTNCLRD